MSGATPVSAAARNVILALADDEHLMGQQHTEWIGVAPFLEEDLAFASIGQDELGHAALLLEILVGSDDLAIDELAFYREPSEWRSCALVEQTLPDWGDTLVRHWLYDTAEELRWQLFANSSLPALAAVAVRAQSEERFHRRHADALLDALLLADDASQRLLVSLAALLPDALGLFEGVADEATAVDERVQSAPLASCIDDFKQRVDDRFGPQAWESIGASSSEQRTMRHDDFGLLLLRMREVLDLDRSAVW